MSPEQLQYNESAKVLDVKLPMSNENIKRTRDKPHIEDSVDFDHEKLTEKKGKEQEFFYKQYE
jgi:hypothetical protein